MKHLNPDLFLMTKRNCIIVADSSRARFFHAVGSQQPWEEVAGIGHPEARSRNRDLTSDRPGRAFDSAGGGRHAVADRTDPHQHEAQVFAREVVQHLQRSEPIANCNKIALIAPPQFLGLLRRSLNETYRNKVKLEIDKNLVIQNVDEIRQQMPQRW